MLVVCTFSQSRPQRPAERTDVNFQPQCFRSCQTHVQIHVYECTLPAWAHFNSHFATSVHLNPQNRKHVFLSKTEEHPRLCLEMGTVCNQLSFPRQGSLVRAAPSLSVRAILASRTLSTETIAQTLAQRNGYTTPKPTLLFKTRNRRPEIARLLATFRPCMMLAGGKPASTQ